MASVRALLSLVMVAGYYVVAFAQFIVVFAITWVLSQILPGFLGLLVSLPLFIVAIGSVVGALWAALRSRHEPMPGVVVTPEQAVPLWTVVRELAALARTRMPDEIRIVAPVNASVSEASRLMGLLPGKRYLYLGIPLLQSLSSLQIRAILAHELGHYSHAHTRLATVAYRGRHAISGTISRISPRNPLGWAFRGYFRLYLLVDRSVSRVLELHADADAVRAAGKAATITALTEVHALAPAFAHFLDTQVGPRAEFGFLPANLYSDFAAFMADRQEEMARLRQSVLDADSSLWDTHPALRERIFEIGRLPEPAAVTEPDGELVPGLAELSRAIAPHVLPRLNCQLLPWDEFVAAASTARLEAEADSILRKVRITTGQRHAGLTEVLTLISQGSAGDQQAHEELAAQLPVLIGLAVVRSGTARWKPSWGGPAALVDTDGEPLPLAEWARLARRPEALARRLMEHGIVLDPDPLRDVRAPDLSPRLLAGLGNVNMGPSISSPQADVIVLNTGLVLIATSRDANEGNKRMQALLDRLPLPQIVATFPFVPFAEVSRATVLRESPLHAQITLYDGQEIVVRESIAGDRLTRDSAKVLAELLIGYP